MNVEIGTRRFGLDAARALAIALVVVCHGTPFWSPFVGWTGGNKRSIVWLTGIDGVELFFALSGFLIGGLLLDIQTRNPSWAAVRIFLIRRAMRTLPLYYLVLAAMVLAPQLDSAEPQRVWSYALLLQNLVTPMPPSRWFDVSWSLTIEEWSYVVLPLLAFGLLRWTRNPVAYGAMILVVCGIAWRVGLGLTHSLWTVDDWNTLIRTSAIARVDALGYGTLAAVFAVQAGAATRYWMLPVAALLLAWNIWMCLNIEAVAGIAGWLLFFPVTGLAFAFLMPWLATWPTPSFAAPVQLLARISYPLYLVHWPVMMVCLKIAAPYALAIYVGASLSIAAVLSYAIEQRIMRMRPRQI